MLKRYVYKSDDKISIKDAMNSPGCPSMLLGNNRNWICILCGPTGTGKSYTALKLAQILDPTFSARKIVFSSQQFLSIFATCRAGDFLIFDEGEEFNARRGMSETNVQMGIILAMLRFTQISLIFTLPSIRMIDINARRLAHAYLYTVEVDRRNKKDWRVNRSGVHWYNIKPVRLPKTEEDLKYVHPVTTKGKKWSKMWLLAPYTELLEEYESMKREIFYRTLSSAQSKLGMSNAAEESTALADETRNRRNAVSTDALSEDMMQFSEQELDNIMRN